VNWRLCHGETSERETTMRHWLWLNLLLCFCAWASGLYAPSTFAANTPTKLTVMVPMRDAIKLATDVYLPAGTGPWPVALVRTPYDRRGAADSRTILNRNGIVVVSQDVRGRFASEGKARMFADDGRGVRQDGVDTVAWIRQQPWSNGKIATFGASYYGMTQIQIANAAPEGIVGQHVEVAPISPYHYWTYQGGVFRKGWQDAWQSGTQWPPEAWTQLFQHPRYDNFWRDLDLSHRLDQVRWPMVFVGGWFDLFAQGTIDAFAQLQDQGGEGARGRQHLVMGPWTHGIYQRDAGEFHFPANAALPPGEPRETDWLRFWLTGQPAIPADGPAVRYYVMGDVKDRLAPGNVWRTADRWPPPSRPLRLYFTADGGLERQPATLPSTREYDFDPLRPIPSLGNDWDGPKDQRRVESWPEVQLFSTAPLAEPLEVTGRLTVRLYAATSARDTDFTAKLTDVYPDGRSMLLADGIVRARYRQSVEQSVLITPGERYAFDIDLWSTSIIFNKGHRIRVAISSSNYPRFDVNANTGATGVFDRSAASMIARQTIFLGGAEASHIVLPEIVATGTP
jgi:predicted acyl esterase